MTTTQPNPTGAALNALMGVPNNFGAENAESAAKVESAFNEGGVLPGLLELADQCSPGSVAANSLVALGVVPDNELAKEGVSTFVNATTVGPQQLLALKGIYEISTALAAGPKNGAAASHDAGAPDEASAAKKGWSNAPSEGDDIIASGKKKLVDTDPMKQLEAAIYGKCGFEADPNSNVARLPAGASFEDYIAAFMMDVVKAQQTDAREQIKELADQNLEKKQLRAAKRALEAGAKVADVGETLIAGAGGPAGQMVSSVGSSIKDGTLEQAIGVIDDKLEELSDSRQLMMEKLKNTMNKLQQMQQALSNVLNTMHQGAMNVIRNIK